MSEGRQPGGDAGGTDKPPARSRARILVAIDPVRVRMAPIEAAARLAQALDVGLAGLVLQEPSLRRIAALPFTRELRLGSGEWASFGPLDVEASMSALVRQAERAFAQVSERFGIAWSVHVEQGVFPGRAFEVAGAGDLVFVDRAPRFAGGARGYRQVATLYDGSPAAARALLTAAGLARAAQLRLRVVLAADSPIEAAALRESARALVAQALAHVAPVRAPAAAPRPVGAAPGPAGETVRRSPRPDLLPAARSGPPAPRASPTAPIIEFATISVAQSRAPGPLYAALRDGESTLLLLPAPEPARSAEVIAVCDAVRCSLVVLR